MRQIPPVFLQGISVCLLFTLLTGEANARIKTAQIEELIDSADRIVIGRVETVRTTPAAFLQKIGTTILLIASAAIFAFLVWRRKFAIAVFFVVACPLVVLQFDVPFGTYQKVAQVSVSSTIKGPPSPSNILVYYDDSFVCDATHLDADLEYLLFLKALSSGYTMSWYDWSAWTIKTGYAQTERRTWHDAAPIPLAEFIARIKSEKGSPITAVEPEMELELFLLGTEKRKSGQNAKRGGSL